VSFKWYIKSPCLPPIRPVTTASLQHIKYSVCHAKYLQNQIRFRQKIQNLKRYSSWISQIFVKELCFYTRSFCGPQTSRTRRCQHTDQQLVNLLVLFGCSITQSVNKTLRPRYVFCWRNINYWGMLPNYFFEVIKVKWDGLGPQAAVEPLKKK
jgi:hypothetical protein